MRTRVTKKNFLQLLVFLQDKLGINDYKESAWMPVAPEICCYYIYTFYILLSKHSIVEARG